LIHVIRVLCLRVEAVANSFTQRGGAQAGYFNATWPFATLTGETGSLTFSFFGKSITIPKGELVRLSRYNSLVATGLRIEHALPSAPSFIVFWPFDFVKLKDNLVKLGYHVLE
jgi:hypothetical protein